MWVEVGPKDASRQPANDRQVGTKEAEKAQIQTLNLVHLRKCYSKVWV